MEDRVYPESGKPRLNGASYNPKQMPAPATYRPLRPRRRNPICACLGCIFSILFGIILILGVAALIIYLALHPKAPKYHLLDAHITQLNLNLSTLTTPTSSSPQQLTYDISFTLQAYNPNKKIGIYYDTTAVFLFYDLVQVGQDSIAPFYQGHRNTTILTTHLTGQSVALPAITASGLQAAIARQSIPFQLLVKVKARVKVGSWKSPHFKVRDACSVSISPPSASGGARLLSNTCKAKWRVM